MSRIVFPKLLECSANVPYTEQFSEGASAARKEGEQ